jgi:DNA-binding transcriptional MerR regulator
VKMRELIQRTGVSREMIHYYTREGMLPPVEKPRPNQAIYTENHVERILLIKKLQHNHFLPMPMIKQIIEKGDLHLLDEELLEIKSGYFESADYLMPQEIIGEKAFLEYSGMGPERLADFEEYKIITFVEIDGEKRYPHDSVKLGKLIGDMRKRGLSHENGFRRTALKEFRDALMPVLELFLRQFREDLLGRRFTEEEILRLGSTAVELTPLFLYHLAHNCMEKIYRKHVENGEIPSSIDEI